MYFGDATGDLALAQAELTPNVGGGPITVYTQSNDPSLRSAGTFTVQNQQGVQSNWGIVIIGGATIMLIATMLTKFNR
jgi:hypothetical protein